MEEEIKHKQWDPNGLRPLLGGQPTLMPLGYTILSKTLSCNQAVTLVRHFKFLLQREEWSKLHSLPTECSLRLQTPWKV